MFRKFLSISAVALVGAALFFSCGKDNEKTHLEESREIAAINVQKVKLDVQGMTCFGCEYGVESALKKVAGVTNVEANFATKSAEVMFDTTITSIARLVEAVNQSGYSANLRKCCASGSTTITNGSEELNEISLQSLKEEFNTANDKVRVISILSPNCPVCQKGKDVVKHIFEDFKTDALNAFVVWLPMWDGDLASTAYVQASTLEDDRITQGWDGKKAIANLFGQTLALKDVAWDVYLVYGPGVVWEDKIPPAPTFWMHQLTEESGADQQLCLNPQQIKDVIANLIAENI